VAKLNSWINRAKKSDVTCFNSFVIMLIKYKAYIGNYFLKKEEIAALLMG